MDQTMNVSYGAAEKTEVGSLQQLDEELEALETTLKEAEVKFGPVLSQYATVEASVPRPEPATQLRGRVERLGYLRGVLADLISRADL